MHSNQNHVAGDICLGRFTSIKNDFTIPTPDAFDGHQCGGEFENPTHWDQPKREKVKKFRFVICTLALLALAVSVMSRGLFYISIVEMTRDVEESIAEHVQVENLGTEPNVTVDSTTSGCNTEKEPPLPQVEQTIRLNENSTNFEDETNEITNVFTIHDSDDENPQTGLHFSWSVSATNFLLSAFFMGYAPSMFFSGGIAEQYGSVFLLSVCVVGSALINAFTPLMAAFSYNALAASRILLGLLQGPLVPVCYDIFNRWLTMTEMSVFVPLLKVAMAMGTMAGTLLPGVVVMTGHNWTYNFYIGGLVCFVWILVWFPLATSSPQENKWIEESELQRIMRKKSIAFAVVRLETPLEKRKSVIEADGRQIEPPPKEKVSIPWLSIITNPSVLVLTFVKFTYNLGMDFILIESAIYLTQIHGALTETVAMIISFGSVMHMVCITFVGSLATHVVRNESLGFSRTIWRKIFQCSSNFGMALVYLVASLVERDQFVIVAALILLIYFFWMLGAGGESMVPYDLSPKYPATIMGFAHSLSTLSGFAMPSICSVVLGGADKKDPGPWRVLFLLISAALALGGLAFMLVIKAKPILASERAKYEEAKQQQQRQQ